MRVMRCISSSESGSALFIEMSSFFSSFMFKISLGIADTKSLICWINRSFNACFDASKLPSFSTSEAVCATLRIASAATLLCISLRSCGSLCRALSLRLCASSSPERSVSRLVISAWSLASSMSFALRSSFLRRALSMSPWSDFARSFASSASASSRLIFSLLPPNIFLIIFRQAKPKAPNRMTKLIILYTISST